MTRSALLLLALIALAPVEASAQSGTGSEPGYAVVLFGTLSPALIFDVLIVTNLVGDGTVRKGFGINALVFGGISVLIGGAMAITLLNDTHVRSGWGLAAIGVAALGAGTSVLGVYGLTHPHPLEPPPPNEDERRYDRPAPLPPEDSPPPVPAPPPAGAPQVQLFPMFGLTPQGGVMLGLTGTL